MWENEFLKEQNYEFWIEFWELGMDIPNFRSKFWSYLYEQYEMFVLVLT